MAKDMNFEDDLDMLDSDFFGDMDFNDEGGSQAPKGIKGYFKNTAKSVKNIVAGFGNQLMPGTTKTVSSIIDAASIFKDKFTDTKDKLLKRANDRREETGSIIKNLSKMMKDKKDDLVNRVKTGNFVKGDDDIDLDAMMNDSGSGNTTTWYDDIFGGQQNNYYNDYSSDEEEESLELSDDHKAQGGVDMPPIKAIAQNRIFKPTILKGADAKEINEASTNTTISLIKAMDAIYKETQQIEEARHREKIAILSNIQKNIYKSTSFTGGLFKLNLEANRKMMRGLIDIHGILKEKREMDIQLYQHEQQMWEDPRVKLNNVFADGINAPEWLKGVGQNIKRAFDNSIFGELYGANQMVKEMGAMTGGGNLLSMMLNPFSILSNILVSGKNRLGLERLDKTIKNIPAFLNNMMSDWAQNKSGVKGMIGNLFSIRDDAGYIDVSRHAVRDLRAPVAWDYAARQSLVEVIPGLLSKIYAGVTGEPEVYYDHSQKTFKTKDSLKRDFKREKEMTLYSDWNFNQVATNAKSLIGTTMMGKDKKLTSGQFEEMFNRMMENMVNAQELYTVDKGTNNYNYRAKLLDGVKGTDLQKETMLELFNTIMLDPESAGLDKEQMGGFQNALAITKGKLNELYKNVGVYDNDDAKIGVMGEIYNEENLEVIDSLIARAKAKMEKDPDNLQYKNDYNQLLQQKLAYINSGVTNLNQRPGVGTSISDRIKWEKTSKANLLQNIYEVLLQGVVVFPTSPSKKLLENRNEYLKQIDKNMYDRIKLETAEEEVVKQISEENLKNIKEQADLVRQRKMGMGFGSGLGLLGFGPFKYANQFIGKFTDFLNDSAEKVGIYGDSERYGDITKGVDFDESNASWNKGLETLDSWSTKSGPIGWFARKFKKVGKNINRKRMDANKKLLDSQEEKTFFDEMKVKTDATIHKIKEKVGLKKSEDQLENGDDIPVSSKGYEAPYGKRNGRWVVLASNEDWVKVTSTLKKYGYSYDTAVEGIDFDSINGIYISSKYEVLFLDDIIKKALEYREAGRIINLIYDPDKLVEYIENLPKAYMNKISENYDKFRNEEIYVSENIDKNYDTDSFVGANYNGVKMNTTAMAKSEAVKIGSKVKLDAGETNKILKEILSTLQSPLDVDDTEEMVGLLAKIAEGSGVNIKQLSKEMEKKYKKSSKGGKKKKKGSFLGWMVKGTVVNTAKAVGTVGGLGALAITSPLWAPIVGAGWLAGKVGGGIKGLFTRGKDIVGYDKDGNPITRKEKRKKEKEEKKAFKILKREKKRDLKIQKKQNKEMKKLIKHERKMTRKMLKEERRAKKEEEKLLNKLIKDEKKLKKKMDRALHPEKTLFGRIKKVGGGIKGFFGGAKNFIGNRFNDVKNLAGKAKDKIKEKFSKKKKGFKGGDNLKETFTNFVGNFKLGIGLYGGGAKGAFNKAMLMQLVSIRMILEKKFGGIPPEELKKSMEQFERSPGIISRVGTGIVSATKNLLGIFRKKDAENDTESNRSGGAKKGKKKAGFFKSEHGDDIAEGSAQDQILDRKAEEKEDRDKENNNALTTIALATSTLVDLMTENNKKDKDSNNQNNSNILSTAISTATTAAAGGGFLANIFRSKGGGKTFIGKAIQKARIFRKKAFRTVGSAASKAFNWLTKSKGPKKTIIGKGIQAARIAGKKFLNTKAGGVVKRVIDFVTKMTSKVLQNKWVQKKLGKKTCQKLSTQMPKAVANGISKGGPKLIGKGLLKTIGKVVWVVEIALAVKNFIQGFIQAGKMFNLPPGEKPTLGMRGAAGFVKMYNELLFGLPALIFGGEENFLKMMFKLLGGVLPDENKWREERAKIFGVMKNWKEFQDKYPSPTSYKSIFGKVASGVVSAGMSALNPIYGAARLSGMARSMFNKGTGSLLERSLLGFKSKKIFKKWKEDRLKPLLDIEKDIVEKLGGKKLVTGDSEVQEDYKNQFKSSANEFIKANKLEDLTSETEDRTEKKEEQKPLGEMTPEATTGGVAAMAAVTSSAAVADSMLGGGTGTAPDASGTSLPTSTSKQGLLSKAFSFVNKNKKSLIALGLFGPMGLILSKAAGFMFEKAKGVVGSAIDFIKNTFSIGKDKTMEMIENIANDVAGIPKEFAMAFDIIKGVINRSSIFDKNYSNDAIMYGLSYNKNKEALKRFNINSPAEMSNLLLNQAVWIYYENYYKKSKTSSYTDYNKYHVVLPHHYFDHLMDAGESVTKKMMDEAMKSEDPTGCFVQLRINYYRKLALDDPNKGQFLQMWLNRVYAINKSFGYPFHEGLSYGTASDEDTKELTPQNAGMDEGSGKAPDGGGGTVSTESYSGVDYNNNQSYGSTETMSSNVDSGSEFDNSTSSTSAAPYGVTPNTAVVSDAPITTANGTKLGSNIFEKFKSLEEFVNKELEYLDNINIGINNTNVALNNGLAQVISLLMEINKNLSGGKGNTMDVGRIIANGSN